VCSSGPMPKLKPLVQWYCDTCGEVIEKADDGWVEWVWKDRTNSGFRIVHHVGALPDGRTCQRNRRTEGLADRGLKDFLGSYGQSLLLCMLDDGEIADPKHTRPLSVDIREWLILFRRLNTPYYEEARLYMSKAKSDGYYNDWNQAAVFKDESLLELIKEYE